MQKFYYLILFLVIGTFEIAAQIVTDRPDQTEASSTVPKGAFQIESGFLLQYSGNAGSSLKTIAAPNNLLRYGLTEGFELRVFNQYESNTFSGASFSGISDTEIGFKLQLQKNDGNSSEVAFMSHLVIPSGSSDLTNDEYGFLGRLLISHQVSENTSVGYNFGYEYFGAGTGAAIYTLSLAHSVNDAFGLFIEPFGSFPELEEFEMNFNAGMTYLLNDNLQLDFSFGTGITDRMNFLSFGVSWLIERENN